MSGRSGWIAAAVVALLVGAGVAAVTSGDDGPSAPGGDGLTLIASSADAAADAGSARFTFTFTVEGGPQGQMSFDGSGEMDFGDDRASMSMDLGNVGGAGPVRFEIVTQGTELFMKMPAQMASALGGTEWVSMDIEELAGTGAEGLLGGGFGSNDPTETLDFLRGASDDLQTLGSEEVRGVETTHYRASIDVERAIAQTPGPDRDSLRAAFEQYRAMGAPTRFPADVWIDGDGLPRRFVMRMDLSSIPDAPEGALMRISMDMFDYGADVSVEPPDPSQVTDITEMVKDQQGPFGQTG